MPIIFDKVLIILTETVEVTTDMEIILTKTIEIITGYGDSFDRSGRNYNRYGDSFYRNGRNYNRYGDNFDRYDENLEVLLRHIVHIGHIDWIPTELQNYVFYMDKNI